LYTLNRKAGKELQMKKTSKRIMARIVTELIHIFCIKEVTGILVALYGKEK